jgi:diguanylate cyclase (GGDEF)-like protein
LNKVCALVSATANEEFTLRLQQAAMTDPLTGIGNRRALEFSWEMAVTQAERLGNPACIVAIDLDGLKRINDFQGHAAGDEAIVSLCAAMRAALRDTDEIFRIGGDEFVAILPGSPAGAVSELMGRVQQFHAPKFSWGAADTVQGEVGRWFSHPGSRRQAQARRFIAHLSRHRHDFPSGPRSNRACRSPAHGFPTSFIAVHAQSGSAPSR